MVDRQDGQQLITGQRREQQVVERLGHDADVHRAGPQPVEHLGVRPLQHPHAHVRVRRRELPQQRRHDPGVHARQHADPQRRRVLLGGRGDVRPQALELGEDDARPLGDALADRGQRHAVGPAHEQRHAELALQPADRVADRRLRHQQLLGRPRDAAGQRDGVQGAELREGHRLMLARPPRRRRTP
jgi:hypothetical protein